jgi:hypothetical protein
MNLNDAQHLQPAPETRMDELLQELQVAAAFEHGLRDATVAGALHLDGEVPAPVRALNRVDLPALV